MDRNNLTAILAALAIVPLYFKEPTQPAPEKWQLGKSGISDTGEFHYLISHGQLTVARKGPTGEWIVSQDGDVLSRHNKETDAIGELMEMLAEEERRMGNIGFAPFHVETGEAWDNIWWRRRVQ